MKNEVFALVAHDNRKPDLLAWIERNAALLAEHPMICTGTTGGLIEKFFTDSGREAQVTRLKSGPLGGDQQLGARIAQGEVDYLIFFWDPMEPQPHDVDVKALLRLAVLYNIPTASNRASADFLISSPLIAAGYEREEQDFSGYVGRTLRGGAVASSGGETK